MLLWRGWRRMIWFWGMAVTFSICEQWQFKIQWKRKSVGSAVLPVICSGGAPSCQVPDAGTCGSGRVYPRYLCQLRVSGGFYLGRRSPGGDGGVMDTNIIKVEVQWLLRCSNSKTCYIFKVDLLCIHNTCNHYIFTFHIIFAMFWFYILKATINVHTFIQSILICPMPSMQNIVFEHLFRNHVLHGGWWTPIYLFE